MPVTPSMADPEIYKQVLDLIRDTSNPITWEVVAERAMDLLCDEGQMGPLLTQLEEEAAVTPTGGV